MMPAQARVLLIGATGGIGRATAQCLVQRGAHLLVAGRSAVRLSALARELGPGQVAWFPADLASPASVEALAREAQQWGCNVVVHAAGLPAYGPAEPAQAQALQQLLAINLLGPMLLTQALLPHLRAQPKSQVIFVGSVLGAIGLPGFAAYCAGKFGLRGYAQALRRELADSPVRIQYLGPRSTRTPFNDTAVEAYNQATATAMDPPELAAAALVRLLEDEAPERFLGFPERVAARLNGAWPRLLDGAFARHRQALRDHHPTPESLAHPG